MSGASGDQPARATRRKLVGAAALGAVPFLAGASSASADDGATVALHPDSSTRNILQPAGNFKALVLRQPSSGTSSLLELQDSTGTALVSVGASGGATFLPQTDIIPLTVKGIAGRRQPQLVVRDENNRRAMDVAFVSEGNAIALSVGNVNKQAVIFFKGNAPWAPGETVWQLGLDSATPAPNNLRDLFIGRQDSGTNTRDFIVLKHGASAGDPPRLGVGLYPPASGSNKGSVESQVPGSGNGAAFHTFLARARNAQTGYPFAVVDEAGSKVNFRVAIDGSILTAGSIATSKTSAPADSDLGAGQMALWFDQSSGSAKLMVKAKDAGGAVRTGQVSLS